MGWGGLCLVRFPNPLAFGLSSQAGTLSSYAKSTFNAKNSMVACRAPSTPLLEPRVTVLAAATEEPWSKPESAITVTVPGTTTQVTIIL